MTLGTIVLMVAVVAPPAGQCGLCHPDVRVEFDRSVHEAEKVTCVSCHNGNPGAVTVEAAHRGNFRGVPRRKDIPTLCASCHSDMVKMRVYNLPADQLALYRTSQHGQALSRGDETVAVCTDCHGVHEILAPADPRSRVFVRNIPGTCARCHADNEFKKKHNLNGDPYADYAAGVHGRALLEKGNLAAPDCSRCHGAHGAAPPGVGDVDKICGQCHATTRAYYLEGPHRAAPDAAGLPECAACHESHRILPADIQMLGRVCVNCHEEGSAPIELSLRMRTLYTQAAEEIDMARSLVDGAATIPLYVEDYRSRLEEARTSLLESLPVLHAFDPVRFERLTARARSIGQEVESELDGKLEGRKWRRVGLMLFWFYLLLTVAILVRFRRRAAGESLR